MLKKNIAAILTPYIPEEEAEAEAVVKPKLAFAVPENIYTPIKVDSPRTPPIFENENPFSETADGNAPVQSSNHEIIHNDDAPQPPTVNAAPPVEAVPNPAPIAAARQPYQIAQDEYNAAQDRLKNAKNEDKGFKGALLEGIQNFLHGMGEARRMNPRAGAWEVLAGGGMGTGFGYVDRSWNERRKYQREADQALGRYDVASKQAQIDSNLQTAESNREDKKADNLRQQNQFDIREKNRFQLEKERFQNRMAQIDKQAQIEGNKWKKYVDEEGKVWKQFNNGKTEPFMNPENPKEQDVDPNFKLYEVVSPMTGTLVKIKGSQLFTGESQMNAANTGIANQQLGDENAYETRIAKLNGDISTSSAKIAALEADYAKVQNAQYDDEIRKRDSIEKELRDERAKLAGFTKERDTLPKPQKRQMNNTGGRYSGQVFPSPSALKAAFPNKSESEIRQIIEANGGRFQK